MWLWPKTWSGLCMNFKVTWPQCLKIVAFYTTFWRWLGESQKLNIYPRFSGKGITLSPVCLYLQLGVDTCSAIGKLVILKQKNTIKYPEDPKNIQMTQWINFWTNRGNPESFVIHLLEAEGVIKRYMQYQEHGTCIIKPKSYSSVLGQIQPMSSDLGEFCH